MRRGAKKEKARDLWKYYYYYYLSVSYSSIPKGERERNKRLEGRGGDRK
jgi:hypothetical protein